jgi:hypothetical protein
MSMDRDPLKLVTVADPLAIGVRCRSWLIFDATALDIASR